MGDAVWTVVVPVKRLPAAKSRLRGALDDARREALALALACDTVTAAGACPTVAEVLVVTDDAVARIAAAELGARVVPDVPAAGLNAALRYGADVRAGRHRWRAGLAADLPALRPMELADALRAARDSPVRRFVADAAGVGTVLLTAPPGTDLDPRFGPASAAAHAASGARPLSGDWPGLRRDVDTAADLRAALALGAGPHTTPLLADLAHVVGDPGAFAASAGHHDCKIGGDRAGVACAVMQGTVASFDPVDRTGTLLLDDGAELAFAADAFDRSGLRLLRLGQRLRVDSDEAGRVVRISLPGID